MRQGPDYIQFYPTLRCNRSCAFCFNQSVPGMDDMPVSSFRVMLSRLPATVKTVDIIGGEPTLHPGIVVLIQAASSAGLRINLSSNGTNIAVLKAIASAEPDTTIGISVNDRETLNDLNGFIRTTRPVVKTVYARQLARSLIRDILLLGPKAFYSIYRDAAGPADVPDTIPFPEFLSDVSQWSPLRQEPEGAPTNNATSRNCLLATARSSRSRGSAFHPRRAPGDAKARDFKPGPVGTVYCSGFLPDTVTYPDLASVRCPAGTTKLGVLPDGSVYPCNLLFGRPEFLLGNILTDPFEAIWNHTSLAFFRKFTQNRCPRRDCRLHVECHGGCPAQSLLLTGDLDAPDPRCVPG